MTLQELQALRLSHQHLLTPVDSLHAAGSLCGLQAQYPVHALHALRLRSDTPSSDGMVRSWTLRGTLHLFPEADCPLYFHQQGTPEDVCHTAWYQWCAGRGQANPPERERFFAHLIVEAIASGTQTREALRLLCRENGMTEAEEAALFHSWGGILRELAELGIIALLAEGEKAYRLLPSFPALTEREAGRMLMERYVLHYGPVTLRDAASFFRTTQKQLKAWLQELPVSSFTLAGRTYFSLPQEESRPEIPDCLLLAGFDPLMMGYRKEDHPFLPPEYMRHIFHPAGQVYPAILLQGRVVGRWKYREGVFSAMLFQPLSDTERRMILTAAEALWTLRKTEGLD